MTYTVRPISDRTPFTGRHQRSPFDSSWSATEQLLLREVRQLKGKYLVVEVDVPESQIRNDGRLYARAQAATPATRVAFESKHGPLTYATDRFSTWQDNVRAIALGLESLRRVDRYGITERGEQYAGFKALPAGREMPASHMTLDEAWSIIGSYGDGTIAEQRAAGDPRAAWRRPDTVPWGGADWSNAMCGEAGEAANVVKKLRRHETGTGTDGDPSPDALVRALGHELADVIAYATLLADYYDIDLADSVAEKFNIVSEREGFPERLPRRVGA